MNSVYILSYDENQAPYIEHWGLKKGAARNNHKYVARISTGNGQYRYFYTQKEFTAYNNQQARARQREANTNQVSLKQYLTGGTKKKIFNKSIKTNRKLQREARKANKANHKAVKDVQKAYAGVKKAREKGDWSNIQNAEKKLTDAKKNVSATSQNASKARANLQRSSEWLKKRERDFESTSLPGQAHRLVREGREKINSMLTDIGDTPVRVRKSN